MLCGTWPQKKFLEKSKFGINICHLANAFIV